MMQATKHQNYEAIQEKRHALVGMIQHYLKVVKALDMKQSEEILERLAALVLSDSFKVLVLGEFKRGKSTLINAMLGQEILPATAPPTTAIINEIKWGETPRALLYPVESEDLREVKPQEIPVSQIEKYVVIKDNVNEIHGNPYDKVELFYPLELCRNGVEIIDSPGLNESEIRQKITIDYLSNVDAVLFVLSCECLGSKSEMDVVDNTLIPIIGDEDIFFICNRFNLIRAKEKNELIKHGLSKLAPRTKQGAARVFFISALDALEGRLEGDLERVNHSNVPLVERELEKFLAAERGRVKIVRPARQLQTSIYEARRVIPERESMLRTDLQTLESRYEAVQQPLHRLEAEQELIVRRISNFLEEMELTISAEATSFYRTLPHKIEEWVIEFNPKNSFNPISLKGHRPQVERIVKEISSYLANQVENELLAWSKDKLQPLVKSRLERLSQEIEKPASQFVKQVDELRVQVAGSKISPDYVNQKEVTAIERLLAATGGFVIGLANLGLAAEGAILGYQEMAKDIIPHFFLNAGIWVLVAAGILELWIAPLLILVPGLIKSGFKTKAINNKIKEETGKRFAAMIRDSAKQRGREAAQAVIKRLKEFKIVIDRGLAQEIQNVRQQVNSILQEKQKGQAEVEQKISELRSLSRELNKIDELLDKLIVEFAMPSNAA